ncbi:MAG TPA: flippase [Chloroflexi bacterium]|nr:flippase [Chloroflexota bacterium]
MGDCMAKTTLSTGAGAGSRGQDIDSPVSNQSNQNVIITAKGGGIAFAGNLAVYAIRFVFGVTMARLLGADLLGMYSLSLTVVGVVGVLASLGLSAGMARYVSIAIGERNEMRLWETIQVGIVLPGLIGLLFAVGVFMLAGPLSIQFFERSDMVAVLRLASWGIPLLSLLAVLEGIAQGFKRFEYIVYETVAMNLLKLLLSAALIWVGLGVMGAVAAHVIAQVVAVVLLIYFVHRLFPLNRPWGLARRRVREILRFTLPLYFSQLLRRFSGSIETLILGAIGVMSGVGIYATVLNLSSIGIMFHNALQKIAVPMISDLHHRGKTEQLQQVYRTTTKWGLTFNLPIFLIIAAFAGPLLAIFGDDFVAGATGLTILAFSTFFNASTGVCGSVITMTGHSRLTFVNSLIYLGVNVLLDLLFIPRWGVMGAAIAVTLSGVLINTLRVAQVWALLRLWPYDVSFLKPIVAGLTAVTAVVLTKRWLGPMPAILQVVVGTLLLIGVYIVMIVSLKLSEEDRLVLDRLRARLRTVGGNRVERSQV